jgi:hypothetical protein
MVSDSKREVKTTASSGGCDVDIKIDNQGDINIYNCTEGRDDRKPPHECPEEYEDCKPQRAEGACVPLGLGCKPKQSKCQKLEQLRARNKVPSALAASFFQTARWIDHPLPLPSPTPSMWQPPLWQARITESRGRPDLLRL